MRGFICASINEDTSRLWHMRVGHAGENALKGLVKQGLLKRENTRKLELCKHCVIRKETRVKFDAEFIKQRDSGLFTHRCLGIDRQHPSEAHMGLYHL